MLKSLIVTLTIVNIPSANAFEISSWPFEGIPYFRVVTDTLILHIEPSNQSPLAAVAPIEKESIISFPYGVKELIRKVREGKAPSVQNEESINTDIMLDKSIQRTTSPGLIEAVAEGKFDGNSYGKVETLVDSNIEDKEKIFYFKKGDVIEELSYLGEGVCLFRSRGEVFSQHGCLIREIEEKRILLRKSQPVTEWWLSFKKNGEILGWLKMGDKNSQIKVIDTIK